MKRRYFTISFLVCLPWLMLEGAHPLPSSFSASDTISPASWTLPVTATVPGASDSLAALGVRSDATSDYDSQYEIPRPPPPPGISVQVYFPHTGGNWPMFLGTKFAVDYTSPVFPGWRMVAETNAGAVPLTLRWDTAMIGALPPAYHLLMRDSLADSLILLRATDAYTFTYTEPRVFLLHAEFTSTFIGTSTGWNILSAPGIVTDYSATNIFPGGISPAYDFDSAYHPRDSMTPGKGYWMKFASPSLSLMTGLSIDSLGIQVRQGWNMIGALSSTVQPPSSPEIISLFYEYAGGYRPADSIVPGKGYWVKVSAAGILTLRTSSLKPTGSVEREKLAGVASVNLRQTDGTGTTLRLLTADEEAMLQAFDLPPVPPEGAFDARFPDGGGAALLPPSTGGDRIYTIVAQTPSAEILIDGDVGGSPCDLFVETGPDQWKAITGTSEPVALTCGPGRTIIRIRSITTAGWEQTPPDFRLEGNYPNPFNPTTRIRYQLPEEAVVTVMVFDPSGRTVHRGAPLLQGAGRREYTFDAGHPGLAGGVYFYTVRGSNVQSGRQYSGFGRMIFLK